MYSNLNPYEAVTKNRQRAKDFFKKPFTLAMALLYLACAILPAVFFLKLTEYSGDLSNAKDYLSMSLGSLFSAPVKMEELFSIGTIAIMITSILSPLLVSVSFIMLFIVAKNKNPNKWGRAGCSVLIGGSGVASFGMTYTACMIIFPLIDLFDRIGSNKLSDEQTSYIVRLIVTLCAFLLYSLSFGMFTKAVFKNFNTPIFKGGFSACFFAVSSIIVGAVYMLFTIDMSESASGTMDDNSKLMLSVFALSAITHLVTSAFALVYFSHLKKQPVAVVYPTAPAPAQQTVPVNQTPVTPVTPAPVTPIREADAAESVTTYDIPAFCPECGNAVTPNQLFCAECGTKLN